VSTRLVHRTEGVPIPAASDPELWWREVAMHGNVTALFVFLAVSILSAVRGHRSGSWQVATPSAVFSPSSQASAGEGAAASNDGSKEVLA
jgi:hypothetical protein